ncbi:hypothetical protein [Cupriavidus pauculus]|uniref:hypothetical protein n=1 Tax=Cupriavidus pauculus TaxID=82633 RepID=UPI0012FE22E0|nr:hypothetical protein [Cupriavidus pauculus]MBY4731304.1 hypothetical protein [Cupriavidus pauculus]
MEQSIQRARISWPLGLTLAASAVVSLLVLCWVLWFCQYGIDFADEGFYLVWIANPYKYSVSATQFGYVYHPLYLLLNGSAVALRIANVLLTFFLAWWVAALCLSEIFLKESLPVLARVVTAGALGTTAFIFLRLWLPTPSYNWLAFHGTLVAAAGILLAEKHGSLRSWIGWTIIGVAVWLTFMAKPTTGAALSLLVIVYLVWSGKLRIDGLLVAFAVALALCVMTALAIDGSVTIFVHRLQAAADQGRLLGAGHTLLKSFRLDTFRLDLPARQFSVWAVMFICGASFLMSSRNSAARCLAFGLTASAMVTIVVIVLGIPEKPIEYGEFQHLILLAVPAASLLLAVALSGRALARVSRRRWALGFLCLALPHAFAFGTSNNYWWFGGLVGVFWVMAALVLLEPVAVRRNATAMVLPIALGAQLIAVTQVHSGIEGPYYQPQPLHADDYSVDLGSNGGTIILPRTYGRYVTAAQQVARRGNFVAGTPMIDLSGHSPGLLFAIGASNTAQAWIIGNYRGYTGSELVAERGLKAVSCGELGSAWLLVEPDGPVSLSVALLSVFGASLQQDYELVGEFETAPIVGGFTPVKLQQIYRPRRSKSDASEECEIARGLRAGTPSSANP